MKKTTKKLHNLSDVESPDRNIKWVYTDIVKDHFFNPRNMMLDEKEVDKFNGVGVVGSPACGDVMKMWIRVDKKSGKIKECKWKTFGCASAIASTSMLSVMVTEKGGMTVDEALKIKPQDIIKRLGGLPSRKIHCSVLGDQALKKSIENFLSKSKVESKK